MTHSPVNETTPPCPGDVAAALRERVIGQAAAIQSIVPYIQMYEAGLAPEGRPVGVFLLLGPTGTGKTRTVEALAEVLHGSEKNVLRIDCGEFQMEHEVAKLIGAPPGYLGHRETHPMITQQKLNASRSQDCGLSLVLFDEVEKAAPSMARLLLGVLDKATLHLGDNTSVNFESSLIFLTTNLGAREMYRSIRPGFGFPVTSPASRPDLAKRLARIGMNAVRRCFPPEFVNRIDVVIPYEPLDRLSLGRILDQHIEELERHIRSRLGERAFTVAVSAESREFLLREGTSPEFGARELKRTLHRHLIQPLAARVASGEITPGSQWRVRCHPSGERLEFVQAGRKRRAAPAAGPSPRGRAVPKPNTAAAATGCARPDECVPLSA